jgi:hypothetical protein
MQSLSCLLESFATMMSLDAPLFLEWQCFGPQFLTQRLTISVVPVPFIIISTLSLHFFIKINIIQREAFAD